MGRIIIIYVAELPMLSLWGFAQFVANGSQEWKDVRSFMFERFNGVYEGRYRFRIDSTALYSFENALNCNLPHILK